MVRKWLETSHIRHQLYFQSILEHIIKQLQYQMHPKCRENEHYIVCNCLKICYNNNMEEIYRQCDRIIDDKALSYDSLLSILKCIKKPHKGEYTHKVDTYASRANTMNHRAKARGCSGRVSATELRSLMEHSGNKCKKCGRTEHLVFDHIKPLYSGGDNTIDNLQVLCRICNMEKGIRDECY